MTCELVARAAREMTLPKRVDLEEMKRLYVEEELSLNNVRVTMGLAYKTVAYQLRIHGVHIRTGEEAAEVVRRRKIVAAAKAGKPICIDCEMRLDILRVVHDVGQGVRVCDMCWHRREDISWEADPEFFK